MDLKEFQEKLPKDDMEMAELLMAKALEGPQSKFEFIRNWEMRKIVKVYYKGLKAVVKMFTAYQQSMESDFYSKPSVLGAVAAAHMRLCTDFYKEEMRIAKEMLKEYREYIFSFHLIDTFVLNRWRPDSECYDHRYLFKKKK